MINKKQLSDMRDKEKIADLPIGTDFINKLRPVKFTWNTRDGTKVGIEDVGFVAQELDAIQSQFNTDPYLGLVLKSDPTKLEINQDKLIPVLVKAIQELSKRCNQLEKLILHKDIEDAGGVSITTKKILKEKFDKKKG